MEAGLAAIRSPQQDLFTDLVDELSKSEDPCLMSLGTSIQLRRAITLGHTNVCLELIPFLEDQTRGEGSLEIAPWVIHNIRGILCDDRQDAETALHWFERAASYASSYALGREEQMSRQNVVRTATRYGRRDLIKTTAAYLGRVRIEGSGTHEALGEIFEHLGDWDSALWHYDNSERINVNAVPQLGRARIFLASGKSDLANEILASLETVATDDIRTRSGAYVLAAIACLAGDPERSRSLANEVLNFGDSDGYEYDAPDAQLTLAECEISENRVDSALDILEHVGSPQMLLRDRMRFLGVKSKALWIKGSHAAALAEQAKLRTAWQDLDEMRSLLWETYRGLIRANRDAAEVTKLGPINDDLQAASQAMHVSAAQIGHDLRSGLGVIKLAMSVPDEEPMRRIARSALDQMNDIVEQVQWASTIEDSKRLTERLGSGAANTFDFAEVLRQSLEQHALQIARKGQVLTLSIGAGPFSIRGHRILAVQIANNLIQNARHYTPEGGTIDVELAQEHGFLTLDVIDDGVGVPHGEEERIFRAFVRIAQTTSSESSTGLGLYIVKSSVERLGGQVSVRHRPGKKGSIFRVRLPTQR